MALNLKNLAEQQIKKAQAEGQLDKLAGAGKPLASQNLEGSSDNTGFRIMAEAGVLPKEIELQKAIGVQRDILKATIDPIKRKQEMQKLADIELRLSIEQEARRKYFGSST